MTARQHFFASATRLHTHFFDNNMATRAIAILSSSPPPIRPPSPSPAHTTATSKSSSPGLPSPSSFFTKPPSQAIGFTTAASLLRSNHFRATENGTNLDESDSGKLPKTVKKAAILPRKSRKPIAKSASFVLNSDDLASTQFAGLDATQVQGKRPDLETFRLENAPTEKPKRAPRKPKKQDGQSEKPVKKTASKSAHFRTLPVPAGGSATDIGVQDTLESAISPVQAPRRRLSWTPVKNSTSAPARPETPASVKSQDDERPTKSLAAVLGDLAYAKQDVAASQRSASGEALLKRRRIELADEATTAPKARKPVKPAEAEPKEKVKKAKLPKKKPQTITEIATKAYRSEDVPEPAQATVSSFFAAPGEDNVKAPPAEQTPETVVKPKKPRKPREKKTGDDAKTDKPKKPAKPKAKAKVRFNEDDLFGELYEPEQARLQEGKQDFLFGTSSQLGTRESPTFIRQMQIAMRESEAMSTAHSNISPTRKSCIGVPSAPHGTSLSCGQATRELWCSAARDHTNDTLAAEESLPLRKALQNEAPLDLPPDFRNHIQAESTKPQSKAPASLVDKDIEAPLESVNTNLPQSTEHDIVDLCYTSPIAADERADLPVLPDLPEELPQDYPLPFITDTEVHDPQTASDDDWMILRSGDSSPDVPLSKRASLQAPVLKPVPQLRHSATSPIRDRSALQALDANVSPRTHTSPHKAFLQKSLMSTTSVPIQKRPRGRPKKIVSAGFENALVLSPKRPVADTESQPVLQASRHSPSRVFSASQPIASSDFANIDEISDSEPEPLNTPSPPRRRAASTPPTIRPLELEVVASPSIKAKAKAKKLEPKDTATPALAWSKLKPDDATWTTVMPILFPQITATVKSTPPSNDMAKPTWYEKILLYDPIVLEDLTAWLNEQGVRIESKKLKAKPKVKAKRKKKDAQPELDLVEETAVVDEYETVRELLKPWMVQKWCEDKSICCLWKEGLRGGVRTRY